jgi:hypothetical protein
MDWIKPRRCRCGYIWGWKVDCWCGCWCGCCSQENKIEYIEDWVPHNFLYCTWIVQIQSKVSLPLARSTKLTTSPIPGCWTLLPFRMRKATDYIVNMSTFVEAYSRYKKNGDDDVNDGRQLLYDDDESIMLVSSYLYLLRALQV